MLLSLQGNPDLKVGVWRTKKPCTTLYKALNSDIFDDILCSTIKEINKKNMTTNKEDSIYIDDEKILNIINKLESNNNDDETKTTYSKGKAQLEKLTKSIDPKAYCIDTGDIDQMNYLIQNIKDNNNIQEHIKICYNAIRGKGKSDEWNSKNIKRLNKFCSPDHILSHVESLIQKEKNTEKEG